MGTPRRPELLPVSPVSRARSPRTPSTPAQAGQEYDSGPVGQKIPRDESTSYRSGPHSTPRRTVRTHKSPATCQGEHANGSTIGMPPKQPWPVQRASSNPLFAMLKNRKPPNEEPQTTPEAPPSRFDPSFVSQAKQTRTPARSEGQNEPEASRFPTQPAKVNDQLLQCQCLTSDQ